MKENSNNKTLKSGSENFPGIIFHRYKDNTGNFSYAFDNNEVYNILELSPQEEILISSKGYMDAVHWADRYAVSQQIEKSEIDLSPYIESFRLISKSGKISWLSGKVTPYITEDGTIAWDGFLLNETHQKQTEQKLDIILDSSNDIIVNVDNNGVIIEANNAIYNMLGYEKEALVGKKIYSLLVDDDKDKLRDYILNYPIDAVYNETKVFDFLALKNNGDFFPIELSISAVKMQGEISFLILIKDIREQKETLATLKETEEKLSTVISALPCTFFTVLVSVPSTYKIIYLSEGSSDIFGFTPDEFFKNSTSYINTILDKDKFSKYMSQLFTSSTLPYFDEEMVNPTNKESWIQVRIKPKKLSDGSILCQGIVLDITDRVKSSERIKFLAYHHHVTGTANRSLLGKEMLLMIEQAEKTKEKLAVLSIVSNNLSLFYASSGHDVGDTLLKEIALRIKNSLEDDAFLAYTTIGLFIAVIQNASDENKVSQIIDNIMQAFVNPIMINEQVFDININIGVALYPEHGLDTSSLIKNSNAALERAKKDYKDYKFFSEEINQSILNINSLRSKLRVALDNGEIIPYFQPQIEINTGKIVGTEALARWITPEEMIPPGVFIPIAEEYGLIDQIAEVILEKACYQNQKWIEEGVLSVPVAVNISPRQFHNPKNLLKLIDDMLVKTGLSPDMLEIELTESSTMINPQEAEKTMKVLLNQGIACSIDDFGTGYSSLSVLKRFPLSKLKIDRSFVIDITKDHNDASIVSATVAMAKALNLKVLAEGVETKDIYCFLKKIGCTSIQGFLFSKPLPANEMTEFANNWNPKEILKSLNSCD